MPRHGYIDFTDFSGGLNTKQGAGGIAENQYSEALNVYLVESGIAKRKGFSRYNDGARISTTAEGLGIFEAPFVDAGNITVAVAGSVIAKKGTNAWTDITGSVSLTTGKKVQFCMQNNVLVGVNGTNKPWYFTGSGNAQVLEGDNIPTAPTCCESFRGRLLLAQGRELRWSEYMGDWNKPFYADNVQYFNDAITGLKIFGDDRDSFCAVLTRSGVHICQYNTDLQVVTGGRGIFEFKPISEKHGCQSVLSVQECVTDAGDIVPIWADRDGLKAYAQGKILKLTENIQPDWDTLNSNYLSDSVGVFYKPKRWYLLFVADEGSTTHNKVIVYDLRKWCVVGFFDWEVSNAGIVIDDDGEERLIGSDYSGYWNTYDDSQNDNGVAINAYFTTRADNGGLPFRDKALKSIAIQHAYFGKYDIDISVLFDHTGERYDVTYETEAPTVLGNFVLDQDALGVTGQLVPAAVETRGWGRVIQIKVGNSEEGQPFLIHNMTGYYMYGGMITER